MNLGALKKRVGHAVISDSLIHSAGPTILMGGGFAELSGSGSSAEAACFRDK